MKDQSSNWEQLGGFVRSAAEEDLVSIAPAKDSSLQLGQLSELIGQNHPRLHQFDCHGGPATREADRCHFCGVNAGRQVRESTTMEHLLPLAWCFSQTSFRRLPVLTWGISFDSTQT